MLKIHNHDLIYIYFFPIIDVGYNMYKKNYEAPNQSEGFDEIIHIDFTPKFDSETHEKIFHYYTES
jgi:bifunctional polynucleotide phosphatase/kinase